MKNWLTALALVITSLGKVSAQDPADKRPAYVRFPALPAFNLLKLDSTAFNTYDIPAGLPVVIMFFGPDCDHCAHQVQNIVNNMEKLSNVRFYLVSIMNLPEIKGFYRKLNLKKYPNINLYKDPGFFFPKFYEARTVPVFVIYDGNKQFVSLNDGVLKMNDLEKLIK